MPTRHRFNTKGEKISSDDTPEVSQNNSNAINQVTNRASLPPTNERGSTIAQRRGDAAMQGYHAVSQVPSPFVNPSLPPTVQQQPQQPPVQIPYGQYMQLQTYISQLQMQNQQLQQQLFQQMPPVQFCAGISLQDIESARSSESKPLTIEGFPCLVGEAIRAKATFVQYNDNGPIYDDHPRIAGYLLDKTGGREGPSRLIWRCVEHLDGHYSFQYMASCSQVNISPLRMMRTDCCDNCRQQLHNFNRRSRTAAENEDDPSEIGRIDMRANLSTGQIQMLLNAKDAKLKKLRRSILYSRGVIARLRRDKTFLMTEVNSRMLLGTEEELKEKYQKMVSETRDVDAKEIMKILFEELMSIRRRVDEHGNSKGCRWSPLMIQFAIYLRGKVNSTTYDFIRQVFNLPSNRTVMRYANSDTTSPDGACLETIMQAAVAVKKDEENSMKEFGKTDDIGRYGKISFDAHVVRGKFAFCYHTGEFKGVSTDAFDLDIIVNEYKRLEALEAEEDEMMAGAPSEGNGDAVDTKEAEKEDEDDEEEMKGRHYLVMRFQTWSGKSTPINFNAAKYCLKSPNSRWLRRNIRKIVAILATFGFYVTGYAFDGATENRSFIKHTMDMTLGDVLPHLLKAPTTAHADGSHLAIAPSAELPADPVIQQASSSDTTAIEVTANMEESPKALDNTKRQFTRDQIPFVMVVAHMHPVVKDLLIAALGDMSHAAKKQCNALEKGYLQLDGKPMSLKMLYDCWEHCPDSSGRVGKVMHFPGITREVFVKDAKNRMRVPLAVKAQSNSMVKIIQTYGRSNAQKCNMETYDSLIEHCTKTNRWVDVMNNSRDKGCEQIDDPDHPHCYELLGYVEYHHRWMLQARGKKCGVPKSTYEDVVWTCIGVVITAHQLLNKFPFALDGTKNRIHQRLHGSDDCEMLFAMSRGKNANADAKLTDNNISGSLGTNVMNQLAASSKTNCGKVNTIPSKNLDVQKTKRQKLYNTH